MGEEKKVINKNDMGKFLTFVSNIVCQRAEQERKKPKEMFDEVEAAAALGLMMAERQPELMRECEKYWVMTRSSSSDEFIDTWIEMYQSFEESTKGKK